MLPCEQDCSGAWNALWRGRFRCGACSPEMLESAGGSSSLRELLNDRSFTCA